MEDLIVDGSATDKKESLVKMSTKGGAHQTNL